MPPSFNKAVFKEIVMKLETSLTKTVYKDYIKCKPKQVYLIPEDVDPTAVLPT
jgi:hypothetical protein